MDKLDVRCFQCGHKDIKSIRQCSQRAWQACPYTATPFNIAPSYIGYAWPDYINTFINILLINLVLWLIYIVMSRGRILSDGILILIYLEVVLFIGGAVILLVYRGSSRKSAPQKNPSTALQPLQKRLTHYYRPADRRGFVAYERFGLSMLYGTTAVLPISLTQGEPRLAKYPPSLLSVAKLVEISDFSKRMLAQNQLAPQIVRWTLLGLAAQDLIQLSVTRLTRWNIANKRIHKTLVFVTPKPKLISHQATGLLETEFIRQLRQQADTNQAPSHWGSISAYELVYNLYEQAIHTPSLRLITRIVDDAVARGWAERTSAKGLKAKVKSLYVIHWRLAANHNSSVMAERKMLVMSDRAFWSEHKKFVGLMNTAVNKAMEARTYRTVD